MKSDGYGHHVLFEWVQKDENNLITGIGRYIDLEDNTIVEGQFLKGEAHGFTRECDNFGYCTIKW